MNRFLPVGIDHCYVSVLEVSGHASGKIKTEVVAQHELFQNFWHDRLCRYVGISSNEQQSGYCKTMGTSRIMNGRLRFFVLAVICIVLISPALAKDNPYRNAHKVTETDVPVNIEADTVKLSDTSGITFSAAGYTHTIGRVSIRMKPLLQGLEEKAVVKGNTRSNGKTPMITYEVYRDLIKEQVILDAPQTVRYSYDIGLADWVTTEPDLARPEITLGANKTERVSYPYTNEVTTYARDSTIDINPDDWGNLVVAVNGADVVVLPKPFATDATGKRFELEYDLDKASRTITITGNMAGARYPVTVDPTERVTNGGFETGTTAGWTSDSNPRPTLTVLSGGADSGSYYCRYKGNYDLGNAGYSRIYQTIDYTGVTSVSMAVKVFGYNRYDFVLSDGFWNTPNNYGVGFPGQLATGWVAKSATPSLTGERRIQFWTYGYNVAGIDSITTMPRVIPPVANFYAAPTIGYRPLTVHFTDTSTGSPTAWSWNFGDGGFSSEQNPQHTYTNAGTYTVRLIAISATESNTMEKAGMITVEAPTFSITQVGQSFLADDLTLAADDISYWVYKVLHDDNHWQNIFWKKESEVTKYDFGTQGGGLNGAIFHFHVGHGARDLIGSATSMDIGNWQFLHSSDVERKWGNKNKWVFLYSCEVLSDPSWAKALDTTHGIFGFNTTVPADLNVPASFLTHASSSTPEPLVGAFYNATGPVFDKNVTAKVIFGTMEQYDNDHLSGFGYIAPDRNPGDYSYYKKEWKCWGSKGVKP
jgi:PKD repeat protein